MAESVAKCSEEHMFTVCSQCVEQCFASPKYKGCE